ncbi:MAG: Ku protein [Cyanobacteria bacterium TGS_CYA1]|nr:Ku protein [Cyanobacteria bacterium TGS_CYA1]
MPRAIWSGAIGFGMVNIPIKLYSATSSKSISFHQLHDKCQTRIKEMRWCPSCERKVEWEEISKGYEYSKGQYVILDEHDFEQLPLASKNLIDVQAFVDAEQVDPIYFEKTYYLEPDTSAKKPFALFSEALKGKEKLAIARITMRSRERLCALRISEERLLLTTLLWQDELRLEEAPEIPESKISKQELSMANSLIDLLSKDFAPEEYEDHYREALQKIIDAKIEGEPIEETKPEKGEKRVVNLFEALKASVDKIDKKSKPAKRASAARARTKSKTVTKRKATSAASHKTKRRGAA